MNSDLIADVLLIVREQGWNLLWLNLDAKGLNEIIEFSRIEGDKAFQIVKYRESGLQVKKYLKQETFLKAVSIELAKH